MSVFTKKGGELDSDFTGTELPVSDGPGGNPRKVSGLDVLKFENGKYVQVSRSGDHGRPRGSGMRMPQVTLFLFGPTNYSEPMAERYFFSSAFPHFHRIKSI